MAKSKIMVTFSTDFISHVRLLYQYALQQRTSGKVVIHDINSYSQLAGPAYISSTAAVEAFLNEWAFGPMSQMLLKDTPLADFDTDWLEFLDIRPKLQILPQLMFGKSFDRATQPYQDFEILVKVRNDFVHYKMHKPMPKYVKVLEERSIALPVHPEGPDYAWVHKLSSLEGIRWAHNTACAVVKRLEEITPEEHRGFMASLASGFMEIDDEQARILARPLSSQQEDEASK